jgi:hypothetical protein
MLVWDDRPYSSEGYVGVFNTLVMASAPASAYLKASVEILFFLITVGGYS